MPTFRWILHLDLDQFLAAVEVRRRPELRGLPVVVGGDGDPHRLRQVVATASYEARRFGVRSGMPMSTAVRRCPDAVFLPLDKPAYDEASAEVWAAVRELPVVVEVWGWDEGFLGSDDPDPVALAHAARELVRTRTGLTCCVGVGDSKLTAKLATGFAKAPAGAGPADAPGVATLTRAQWQEVMGSRPVDSVWGIGGRTAATATYAVRVLPSRQPQTRKLTPAGQCGSLFAYAEITVP
jgi:DNA polymerase-4